MDAREVAKRGALALSVLLALGGAATAPAAGADLRDVLGVAHAAGTYSFTGEDFLNEGADQLLALGSRVIKVWLTPEVAHLYPFHSAWGPPPLSPTDLAGHPYFQALFAKPFTTYLLVVEPATGEPAFLSGMTRLQIQAEADQMYELASYLLATYAGTGKTFVLQNWEGDHLLRAGLRPDQDPGPERLRGMTQWWKARQRGVERARTEAAAAGDPGVTVAHAAEVNLIQEAISGRVTATNDVIPYVDADLYSYSSWDLGFDPARLTRALDYLRSKAAPSALYGRRNILLGEYGMAKDQTPPGVDRPDRLRELGDAALAWGVRYAVFWQIYCNEPLRKLTDRPQNADLRGFWLIRPDGIHTKMWTDIAATLGAALRQATLRSASGQYLAAPVARDGPIGAQAWNGGAWETFTLIGGAGRPLQSGDAVYLQTHGGFYLAADPADSGRLVTAGRLDDPPGPPAAASRAAEVFVIHKLHGSGPILTGDEIALATSSGRLLAVDFAGGGVYATGGLYRPGAPVGAAATFHIDLED